MKMLSETFSKEEEEENSNQWMKHDKIRKLATKMVQREQRWYEHKAKLASKQGHNKGSQANKQG